MSEDRATYRMSASTGTSGAIAQVELAFPQASWEIAKSVIHRKGEMETEYWAEIAVDRDRGIEFDAYGDSPAAALLAALALAEKAKAA